MPALSVTVGADVTDLRTKLALAQSDVKAFSAETRTLAQQMRDASDGARAQFLPQLEASAKAAADAKSQVSSLSAELRSNAQAANENADSNGRIGSTLGSSRMAFMEFEHSARAAADALAAGADPMRVIEMEGPRLVQALTELGPGAMAAIVSPAGLATAAVVALGAGLGYLAYESISADNALNSAKDAMALAGNLNASGIKAYNDDIHDLIANYGLGESAATAAAQTMATVKGPAAEYHDQLLNIAVAYSTLKSVDLPTALTEVVKAANGGSESFLKWADQVGVVTQAQKDLVGSTGHDQIEGFRATIDALGKSWVDVGDKIAQAKRQAKEYGEVEAGLALSGASGISPEQLGFTAPANDQLHPSTGSSAPSATEEQASITASAYNKVLVERQGILRDIQTLETAIANSSDPQQKTQLEQALSAAELKAAQLHTASENEAFQSEIGHLKQTAAAAQQGSQARIAALREEAEAIRQRNTLMDDKGAVLFDGQYSQEYQQAETAIAAAVLENQTKNRAEYQKTETSAQHLAESVARMALQIHNDTETLTADMVRGTSRIDQMSREFDMTQQRATQTLAKNQQQINQLMVRPYQEAFQSISQSFNQSIIGMINGSMTFEQAMTNIAEGILDTFVEMGLKMVEDWAEKELEKLVIGQATDSTAAVGQVTSAAAVAAANTFAAISAIPFVGPELAPAAAATSMAEVMAFAPMAGLATGTPNVPQNMQSLLHKGEIVVPESFSQGLRSGQLTLGRPSNENSRGGDHYHVVVQASAVGKLSTADIHDFGSGVADAVTAKVRSFSLRARK